MKIKTFFALVTLLCISFCSLTYPQKAGEVIYSNKLIDPKNPTNLVSSFQSGENIYAVAYLPKAIIDLRSNEEAKKIDAEIFLYEL